VPRRTCSLSPPEWQQPETEPTITLHLRTITPLFGGGYEPREVDSHCIIRSAAIRGHLRFWWRATAGAQYKSAEELFAAEEALWGSAEKPGKVAIEVALVSEGSRRLYSEIAPKATPQDGPREGVFLFPFQAQRGDNPLPEAHARENVEFSLTIRCSSGCLTEVERCVRAWLAFGGVGSRTRRGCGALCETSDPAHWLPPVDRAQRHSWLRALTDASSESAAYTVLGKARVVFGQPVVKAGEAWRTLGRFWCAVRKGHMGDAEGYVPMNGGHWGDYREALARFERSQDQEIALAKPFLGLPIVYQKFDRGPAPARYAPTLEADETGRMASPVILKPIALANGQFAPLIAVLSAPDPVRINVKVGHNARVVDLRLPRADRVLRRMGVAHPLDAVVKFAEQEWRTRAEALP